MAEKKKEKPVADWERIELDYRAGIKTLRQIAEENGISHVAVNKRAKKEGWERDLSSKINAKADALVTKAMVTSVVTTEAKIAEKQVVDVAAQAVADIRLAHRKDIHRARKVTNSLLDELEQQTDPNTLAMLQELGELLRREDDNGNDRRNDRSFDWGSSKPFSVGWWLESNGEPIVLSDGRAIGPVRGDLIRWAEWYGWTGRRNEGVKMLAKDIAQGILDREEDMGLKGRVRPGPADSAIWGDENGMSIERDMRLAGVTWEKAEKPAGSRVLGWERMREMLSNAAPMVVGQPREEPGMFVCRRGAP